VRSERTTAARSELTQILLKLGRKAQADTTREHPITFNDGSNLRVLDNRVVVECILDEERQVCMIEGNPGAEIDRVVCWTIVVGGRCNAIGLKRIQRAAATADPLDPAKNEGALRQC